MGSDCKLIGFGTGFPEALTGNLSVTWNCDGNPGVQKAYRLKIWDGNGKLYWDSDWVESMADTDILYKGPAFEKDSDYVMQVQVLRDDGQIISSRKEDFSTGILPEDWKSKWLRASGQENAAPMFRETFALGRQIKRARLYVCGLGYFEAYVNGEKTGQTLLSPAWTDYRKRVCYEAYNIKPLLQQGENVLSIILGQGWYGMVNGRIRTQLKFSMQMSLVYENGEKEWRYIDEHSSWKVCVDGPIKENSIYIGEVYDARSEVAGWSVPGYSGLLAENWRPAIETEAPEGMLVPRDVEPIERICSLNPVRVEEPEEGTYILDFGQNLSGFVELEIDEKKDAQIQIRYAELLDDKGMLNTANLRTAQARDLIISNGKKMVYCPRFTYHGFRYAQVDGITCKDSLKRAKAIHIRNNVSVRGEFSCANDLINQIQKMCMWTESSNMHWVPTDCPQRDERLGWLNDMTVRAQAAMYHYDLHRFYTKFLQDIADTQGKKTGAITDTVPFVRYGNQPADPVSSSYLILGWLLYQNYGDRGILERFYDGFAAWTRYLWSCTKNGIVTYSYYGDWAAPMAGGTAGSFGAGAVSSITPGVLMSTGFLYYNARLMRKISEILDKNEDMPEWESMAQYVKLALNREFYDPKTGDYATGSQASNVFMAWLGVSPDQELTVRKIVADVRKHDTHLTTGNLCSRYILEVLTENGYVDLAYELVTQTTYPSWGYMVKMGATTTWERWEYVESGPLLGMASHNHPMYATVSAWFYGYLLGIQVQNPGFSSFCIHPYFPEKLESAKGVLNTIKGKIIVEWEKQGQEIVVKVAVPFNTTAQYVFENALNNEYVINGKREVRENNRIEFTPGRYEIRFQMRYNH